MSRITVLVDVGFNVTRASSSSLARRACRTREPLRTRERREARERASGARAIVARARGSDDDVVDADGESLLSLVDDRCPVPKDQRPSSQLIEIQESAILGWPALDFTAYASRLGGMFTFFWVVIAYPIACGSYDPSREFEACAMSATVGALGATAAMALNMYNGWTYVEDRLLSATVEYEETGWYDGQVYVKDPEMLARDRLLGMYTVRPVVETLRKTLFGCGATALVSLAGLRMIDLPQGVGMSGDYGSNGGYFSQTKDEAEEEEDADVEELMQEEMKRAFGAPAPAVDETARRD